MKHQEQEISPKKEKFLKIKKKSVFQKILLIFFIAILLLVAFGLGKQTGTRQGQVKVVSEPGDCVSYPAGNVKGSQDGAVQTEEVDFGQVTDKSFSFPDYFQKDVDFSMFWEVWNMLQTEYVDRPVAEPQLFYGALEGMVSALDDPYSVYMLPEESEDFYEELDGKFEGIGAELAIKHNVLTVVSPLKDSPAESAGLKAGDIILEIDGESTEDMSIHRAVDLIRGPRDTDVVLDVFREKTSEFLEITITRGTIQILSSQLEFEQIGDKNIALIELTNFNSDTDYLLRQNIAEILTTNPDGIILDLRGNPGGYIDQAVGIASHWVDRGDLVVTERYNNDKEISHEADGLAELAGFKTVVLINGGSASASEILAGALQDYDLATIVGEQSFGKGSVQSITPFKDGSSLRLTVAKWFTPHGAEISGEGITPDVAIELTEEDWDNDLDPQLDKALEILK